MTGIEEANHRIRDVAFEGLRTGWQKERIVLAPRREERRLVGPEVILKGRIERDVALVVAEQVELHLVRARAREIEIVERLSVRRDHGLVGDAVGILPVRRLRGEESAKGFAIGRRALLPIGPDRRPALAQTLFVSISVLRNDR